MLKLTKILTFSVKWYTYIESKNNFNYKFYIFQKF